ncbi:MAG TPA: LPS assembly lipoprotein LptE [Wenzhouxiangella sp.]|nr:LPS assembly lipoprotein LptE [Wenzhouxiangella sp.]
MMLPRQLAMVILAATLIAACGFQLRGTARLPAFMDRTFIEVSDDSTEFVRELRLLLEANGVAVADMPDEQTAVLHIDSQRISRQPLSVSGRAQVREYLLVFELEFRLHNPAGEEALKPTRIRLARDYGFDESAILAAQREEEFLRDDLGRAMAEQLVRNLEALSADAS